jgi:UDP-N-acetylmuramate dehydrogenase
MQNLIEFLKANQIEFHENSEIKPYTTIKIGGRVRLIVITKNISELTKLLSYVQEKKLQFVLLGGGSNVIFPQESTGLITIINKTSEIETLDNLTIKINSGVSNSNLLAWSAQNNIGGLEFLAGIPGTIGGAAAVNAGAFGNSISELLEKADIVTEKGEIKTVKNDYFKFIYRNSIFKYSKDTILNLYLKYHPSENSEIQKAIKLHVKYRMDNHPPYRFPSAGCFFTNPIIDGEKISAGKLLEDHGFKGKEYKDLSFSNQHSNFLINNGNSTLEDVKHFETRVCQQILDATGIKLSREVIYISPQGKKY